MTRRRHTDTSAAAFHSRKKERTTECELILRTIQRAAHGLTILEISDRTGIVSSTVSARLDELRTAGLIHESVIRRKCSINGRKKKVWVESPDSGQLLLGRAS